MQLRVKAVGSTPTRPSWSSAPILESELCGSGCPNDWRPVKAMWLGGVVFPGSVLCGPDWAQHCPAEVVLLSQQRLTLG